jgi:pimeloyl-ACP methyl ester carboxylesterase
MIKKFVGATVALAALGAGALAATAVALGNKRVDAWETLTLDDAGDGAFVTLSDGARMHYVSMGRSAAALPDASSAAGLPPANDVILIHGLMDSAQSWSQNMDALAARHRVWAIDLIGFGYSSRVTAPTYSLKYYARAVREFMDAQGIARASIAGHSLGGAVTLELARAFPERVSHLILIAPATYLANLVAPVKLAARVPYVPRALMGFALTSERARLRAWRDALGDPRRMNAQEALRRVRPARVKGTADALVAMMGSAWSNGLGEELSRISAPTLILWGDRDRAVPLRHGDRHARALPNAEFVILEGAGHVPHIEYPDVVNRLMVEFLSRRMPLTIL